MSSRVAAFLPIALAIEPPTRRVPEDGLTTVPRSAAIHADRLGGSLSAHREQLAAAVNAHPLRWDTRQPDPHNLGPRGEEQFRDFLLKVLQRVDELREWPPGGDPR